MSDVFKSGIPEVADDPFMGEEVRDTVSGFTGITTAKYVYLNGCIRYCVEAEGKDGPQSKPLELVFDQQRLQLVDGEATSHATAGGPRDDAHARREVVQ